MSGGKIGGRVRLRGFFTVLATLIIPLIAVSCASTKVDGSGEGSSESVSIAIPKRKNTSYFFSIKDDVMELARKGDPASIRSLVSKLHKPLKENYTDRETILLNVVASIMSKVWPSESFSADIPNPDFYNPYIPIINSVDFGIYDRGSGESDFFTLLLPNLLVLTGDMKADYIEEMKASLEKCIEIQPDSSVANYLMGMLCIYAKDYDSALVHLQKFGTKISVEPREVILAKEKVYFLCGNYETALEFANRILARNPNDRQSLDIACRSLVKLERWDEAQDCSVKILQIDPENIDYILLRGRILIAKGEYLKASTLLDSCEKLGSNHKDYLLLRGWLQKNWSKNMSAASDTATLALSLYPDDLELLLLAAQIASASGTRIAKKSALELVAPVLAATPDKYEALELYVKECLLVERYEDACECTSRMIDSGAANLDIMCCHVEALAGSGKNDEAWEVASKLYEENPGSEKVVQTYVKAMISADKKKEAFELISNLVKTASSSMKSFLYYEKSLIDSSSADILNDLQLSLSFNARNVDALYRMYRVHYSNKNYKMAQFYLKQVYSIRSSDQNVQARLAELEKLVGK